MFESNYSQLMQYEILENMVDINTKYSLFHQQENLSVSLNYLQALNLSGAY